MSKLVGTDKNVELADHIPMKFQIEYEKEGDMIKIIDMKSGKHFRLGYKDMVVTMENAKKIRKERYGIED